MNSQSEEWRSIPGFPDYMVSSHGRVKTFTHFKLHPDGHIMSSRIAGRKNGYLNLPLRQNKKAIGCYVHQLVASAFIGPRPIGYEINHKDGNKLNNKSENLEYVTPAQNKIHARSLGLYKPENNKTTKLSGQMVLIMRRLRTTKNISYETIGQIFGVSLATAYRAINGQAWKNI